MFQRLVGKLLKICKELYAIWNNGMYVLFPCQWLNLILNLQHDKCYWMTFLSACIDLNTFAFFHKSSICYLDVGCCYTLNRF